MLKGLLIGALLAAVLSGATPAWMQDAATIGIPAGTKAPGFALTDQLGHKRTLASLMEGRGLVLVFFRSADW
jgi:cytochrome oxidase Cu insertion factor (SCO1/SenC/PrrC family)